MRVLVVADIHGNLAALEAVVAAEPHADRVLCLGDLVDYGPSPEATVRWVREHAFAAVRGNHDDAVGRGGDCRSTPRFKRLAVESRRKTIPMLGAEERAYLATLPLQQDLEVDGLHLLLLHAAPGDPLFRYLPATDVAGWTHAVAGLHAELVLAGHTHVPAVLDLGHTRLLNPGSVGLPRDGDPRASYAVLQDGVPELKRVAYDVGQTVRLLWDWGLPHDVASALESVYVEGGLPGHAARPSPS